MTDLELARAIAVKAHAEQTYGDKPYSAHLDEVEQQCREMYNDERTFIIAQLHDILEDTRITGDALSLFFDKDVVEAVKAMTHLPGEMRELYLVRCKANELARKVKIADTFCNLKNSLIRFDSKRINKYTSQLNYLVQ